VTVITSSSSSSSSLSSIAVVVGGGGVGRRVEVAEREGVQLQEVETVPFNQQAPPKLV